MLPNYQVEYQVNGMPKLFEFYLFVNPLGRNCYYSEQELIKTVDMISSKVDIHILTFHNQKIIADFMKQFNIPMTDLVTRNHIYRAIYKASLAYKAASMQGKRKGRIFLMKMQQQVQGDVERLTREFVYDLAKDVGLDVDIFKEDMNSDFVRESYLNDQKIAVGMQVKRTPSLVIFENSSDQSGYIMENKITTDSILAQLDAIMIEECDEIKKKLLTMKPAPFLSLVNNQRHNMSDSDSLNMMR